MGWFTKELKPRFPITYGCGYEPNIADMTLHADGRIEGDVAALRRALASMKGGASGGDWVTPLFWLLINELERQQRDKP